jgi:alpha-tubulin suppressor-like RCC1 family protein
VYLWGSTAVLDGSDLPYILHTDPLKISFLAEGDLVIKDVSATHRHALFLTDNSKVYTSGRDGSTLGLTRQQEWIGQSIPTIIPSLENEVVVDIAVGEHQSFAVTEEGVIYSWGLNQYGSLGRNIKDEEYINGLPTPIEGLPPVQWVNAEEDSVMAVDKKGYTLCDPESNT